MPPKAGKDAGIWGQVAFYSSLGVIVPGGAVAGLLIGWLIDKFLHSAPTALVIGAMAGAAGGIYEVIKLLNRAQAQQNGDQGDRPARPG